MMINDHRRFKRERTTVATMISIYCHGQHGTENGLCPDCIDLQNYAWHRLEKCPFQAGKTTCAQCPIHCYRPEMREKVRRVMRYAGPRMLLRHPVLALFHLVDGLRKEPIRRPGRDAPGRWQKGGGQAPTTWGNIES